MLGQYFTTDILLLLGFLLRASLSTTPTPHHQLSVIRGGGQPVRRVADVVGGIDDNREDAGPVLRIREKQHLKNVAPSRAYGALSTSAVGRYILATSSLVGECARVYAPAPLGLVASSLRSCFSFALDSQGRDRRASFSQKKSSAFSYDKFMSHDPTTDEHLPSEGEEFSTAAVPPNKYGRVSSAFLARHEIGDPPASSSPDKAEGEFEEKGYPVLTPTVFEKHSDQSKGFVGISRRQAKAETMFKSLAALGRGRTNGAEDDVDLLSDSGEKWTGISGEVSSTRTGKSAAVADSDGVHFESTIGRNLIDVDEYSATLVNKLRLGEKTDHVSRRKPRRSRSSKNEN